MQSISLFPCGIKGMVCPDIVHFRTNCSQQVFPAAYRASTPGLRLVEDSYTETQSGIFTYFSRFHVRTHGLTAFDLVTHPGHTQNQYSRIAQREACDGVLA
jgi:hypothetical protein